MRYFGAGLTLSFGPLVTASLLGLRFTTPAQVISLRRDKHGTLPSPLRYAVTSIHRDVESINVRRVIGFFIVVSIISPRWYFNGVEILNG